MTHSSQHAPQEEQKGFNFQKSFLTDKTANYCISIIVAFLLFIILHFFVFKSLSDSRFVFFLELGFSIIFVGSSKLETETRKKRPILGWDKSDTGFWLNSGLIFGLHLYSLDTHEVISIERDKVEIGPLEFNDVNGKKLKGWLTVIWEVGDTEEYKKNYKLLKQETFEEDVKTLLQRVFLRSCTQKAYPAIKAEEHLLIKESDLKVYGIKISHADPLVLSANMDQDDLNNYAVELTQKYKEMYPTLKDSEIAQMVDVRLKLVKKVILNSNAPTVNRFDIDS